MLLLPIDAPNDRRENSQRQRQRPPEEFVFAHHSDINQDNPQAIKPVQEKKQQEQDIEGGIVVQGFAGAGQEIRHLASRAPTAVELERDEQKEANRAEPLDQPGPGASVRCEAFHTATPILRSNSAVRS